MTTYLFLAIPNFCGSTLVHNLLTSSPNIVPLTDTSPEEYKVLDIIEGNACAFSGYKNLRGPHSIEANMEHVYADPKNYDWELIKNLWDKNWEETNSLGIRLQKTPSDIFRIRMIQEKFKNLKWIVSVRDPYAHVEAIMKYATFNMDPIFQLDQICFHALRSLEVQKENINFLGNNAYFMTYEDFCLRPDFHKKEIIKWMPEIQKLDLKIPMTIKNEKYLGIQNKNEEAIQNLINFYPNIIQRINEFFLPHEALLNSFKYKIRN